VTILANQLQLIDPPPQDRVAEILTHAPRGEGCVGCRLSNQLPCARHLSRSLDLALRCGGLVLLTAEALAEMLVDARKGMLTQQESEALVCNAERSPTDWERKHRARLEQLEVDACGWTAERDDARRKLDGLRAVAQAWADASVWRRRRAERDLRVALAAA
jgi:hypothetical protein